MFLQQLDYNIIEQPRPERILLVVFVLKWPDSFFAAQTVPVQLDSSGDVEKPFQHVPTTLNAGNSPVPPGDAVMSPIVGTGGFNNGQVQSHSAAFLENPYAPASGQSQATRTTNGTDTAKAILGTFYTCPVAQQVLESQGDVAAELLRNLRSIFENHPAAQHDMNALGEHLNRQTNPGATAT